MTVTELLTELDPDQEADRYAEILVFLSGHLCAAVRAKDRHAIRVWLNRCATLTAPAAEFQTVVSLLLLVCAQVPEGSDPREAVEWLREFGRAIGPDEPSEATA